MPGSPCPIRLCPAAAEGCSDSREAASLCTSAREPQSAQATRENKMNWSHKHQAPLRHTSAVHNLTFMRAMIQKAYDTLGFSWTGRECGEVSWITGANLKWWSKTEAFSVLFAPRQCSEMNGSAIRGLIKAPSPMKKCSAYSQSQNRHQMWRIRYGKRKINIFMVNIFFCLINVVLYWKSTLFLGHLNICISF